ncbi:tRNA delta(2)-isopentenylpyrophosphate transferase [Solidesulfovibrio fructosivorans JJ]]|uniref:tRNA dimethylallyltransferase n=1 Tax=Solidesulfovibrio fructosivorans JJ] TaxID=596151 RepID=E1JRL2_SOLFR|nr:tRNA (adenosine(37)-N6)-dimethylallyltransferase MiaA [Solidesulfovibrio fructosivorans]EFL53213.1 tRNA delta(2)-isopentenylpyrophosphate transferase [Solidesulfovibrio fructosivorans JJ]]
MTATRIVCLLGATGTGKTAVALALAEAYGGAVVNVDSRQVYAGLPVLTAQPTTAEQGRCPHFLYGDTPIDVAVSAGWFAKRARAVVASIAERDLLPLLVGGTGLYFRAIRGGLAPIPPVPPAIRAEVAARYDATGGRAMHEALAAVDPAAAARIAPADRQRVTRALEVHAASGRALSDWQAAGDPDAPDYDALVIGLSLSLEMLTPRLASRIEVMAREGAVEEVQEAHKRYAPDAPGLTGIGGPEITGYLSGAYGLEEAKARWLANTRAYAKRQMTWFRKEPEVRWFAPGDAAGVCEAVGRWLDGGAA